VYFVQPTVTKLSVITLRFRCAATDYHKVVFISRRL
jgi:hypothetical protein